MNIFPVIPDRKMELGIRNATVEQLLEDDSTMKQQLFLENGSLSGNGSSNSSAEHLEFNSRHLINILAYSLMFFIGTVGNLVVFVAAYRQVGILLTS